MNAQQQRNFRAFYVTDWISQQAVHFSSVFTLEIDVFGLRDLKFIHQGIVLMSDLTESGVIIYLTHCLAFHRVNFSWFRVVAGKHNRAVAADRQTRNEDWRFEQS